MNFVGYTYKADVEAEGPTLEWQREKARLAVEDKSRDMAQEEPESEEWTSKLDHLSIILKLYSSGL